MCCLLTVKNVSLPFYYKAVCRPSLSCLPETFHLLHFSHMPFQPCAPYTLFILLQRKQAFSLTSPSLQHIVQAPPPQKLHKSTIAVSVQSHSYWLRSLSPFCASSLVLFVYVSHIFVHPRALPQVPGPIFHAKSTRQILRPFEFSITVITFAVCRPLPALERKGKATL